MSDIIKNGDFQVDLEAINAPQYLQGTENQQSDNLPRVALFLHEGKKRPDWVINVSASSDLIFNPYKYITTTEPDETGDSDNPRTKRIKREVEFFTKVKTETGDEESILNTIACLGGRIISMPTYPEFSSWDASTNSYINVCRTIGCFLPMKGEDNHKPYTYVPAVPSPTLFDYKKGIETRSFDVPDNRLHDYIGSRGEPCKVCIKNGHAKAPIKGEMKTCKLKGSIYMVVTEIGVNSRTIKMKPLSSFVDSDGNPIGEEIEILDEKGKTKDKIRALIFHIILSPSSIRGLSAVDNSGKRYQKICGSYGFAKYLDENALPSMSSIPVIVSKKKEKTFAQIHIEPREEIKSDTDEEMAIRKFWDEECPDIKEILQPIPDEYLSGFTGEDEEDAVEEKVIEVGDDEEDTRLSSFLDSEDDDIIL